MNTIEEWRSVPSVEDYEASSLGRIRRKEHCGAMPNGGLRIYGGKPWTSTWDDEQKRFTFQYKGKTYRVARCVCEAFNGPEPFPDAVAMHKDENSRNNRSDNLQWATQEQNLNCPNFLVYAARECARKMAGLSTAAARKSASQTPPLLS